MFYLVGSDSPATRELLATALTGGLRTAFEAGASTPVARLEGGELPKIERLSVDLTNAIARIDKLPPPPQGIGSPRAAMSADVFEVTGRPLRVESAGIDLSLKASAACFDYDRDSAGRPLLLLTAARDGQVRIAVKKSELEGLILAGAKVVAGKHGVQVQDVRLKLTQSGARTVSFEARVKAKKLFVSAVVTVRGHLAIDENLNATLSDLACEGEGMMGSMASGLIQPELDKYNDRMIPLTALSLGSVRLRDLQIKIDDSLTVTAAFGS